MQEITLFLGKIYTAGKSFTRPPVLTVATNLNSANDGIAISFSHLYLVIYQHVKVEIPLWQPLHCFQSIALGLCHSRVRPAFFCDQLFAFLRENVIWTTSVWYSKEIVNQIWARKLLQISHRVWRPFDHRISSIEGRYLMQPGFNQSVTCLKLPTGNHGSGRAFSRRPLLWRRSPRHYGFYLWRWGGPTPASPWSRIEGVQGFWEKQIRLLQSRG